MDSRHLPASREGEFGHGTATGIPPEKLTGNFPKALDL